MLGDFLILAEFVASTTLRGPLIGPSCVLFGAEGVLPRLILVLNRIYIQERA